MGTPGCPYLRGVYIFMTPGYGRGDNLWQRGTKIRSNRRVQGGDATNCVRRYKYSVATFLVNRFVTFLLDSTLEK